jgi:hypothetical protein
LAIPGPGSSSLRTKPSPSVRPGRQAMDSVQQQTARQVAPPGRRTTAPRGGQRALLKARPVKAGLPLRAAKPRFATRTLARLDRQASKLKRSRNRNAPTLPGPARPGPTRLAPSQADPSAAKEDSRAPSPPAAASPAQAAHGRAANPAHGLPPAHAPAQHVPAPAIVRLQAESAPLTPRPAAPVHARPVPTPLARRAHPAPASRTPRSLPARPLSTEPVLAARVQGARVQAANGRPAQGGSPRPVTAAPTNPPPASAPSLVPAVPPSPPIGASLVANAPVAHPAERSVHKRHPRCPLLRSGAVPRSPVSWPDVRKKFPVLHCFDERMLGTLTCTRKTPWQTPLVRTS